MLNLHEVAPRDIQLLASRSLMHVEASKTSLAERIGGPPDLEPLRSYLHTIRRTKAAASLRSLGEGGWWTQSRMHEAGMAGVEDDICKACNDALGTLYHRCCGCSANAVLMSCSKHAAILNVAQSAVHSKEPLFQHGIPLLEKLTKPPPFVARWCGGDEVEDVQFIGEVFTDGALRGGSRKGTE